MIPDNNVMDGMDPIAVACGLLDRQIAAQSKAFEKEGGFTERMYRVGSSCRKSRPAGERH